MVEIARQEYTEQQILDALRGRTGSQHIKFRFDVLRGGAKTGEVDANGSVSLNRFATIQRTANFTFTQELDWLHDEIKPYMLLRMDDTVIVKIVLILTWDQRDTLNWSMDGWERRLLSWEDLDLGQIGKNGWKQNFIEFPLGVFVLSTSARQSDEGLNTWSVEAYDHTVILAEDCITEPLYFAAGTLYLDAIQSVLVSANAGSVIIQDYVSIALPAAREFEIGTSKISIVNALLTEINYNSIRCDADGRFVVSKYQEPSADRIDFTYSADDLSIIGRDTASEMDLYSVPNVFIAVCSNPDLEEDYRSVWTNDSPASLLSTVSRGRNIVSEIYQPSTIASQEDLDAYIRRIGFEANQIYEQLTFTTALMPIHESGDSLAINHPDVTGNFIESSWELTLSADGEMTHTVRRLVSI